MKLSFLHLYELSLTGRTNNIQLSCCPTYELTFKRKLKRAGCPAPRPQGGTSYGFSLQGTEFSIVI